MLNNLFETSLIRVTSLTFRQVLMFLSDMLAPHDVQTHGSDHLTEDLKFSVCGFAACDVSAQNISSSLTIRWLEQ